MEQIYPLLGFALDDQRYALPAASVERVVRAVAVTSLPQAPEIVSGIVDLRGRIVPVLDIRCRFLLPPREIALSDQFIVARTSRRAVAIIADSVAPVHEYFAKAITSADSVLPGLPLVQGVVKLPDGLMLINDLDRFLSLDEEARLAASLGETPHG
ncbi:MAG TPA: chemotaxis protein CheW [Methylococcaceae bacterium]|nr:chemotaxis protein CheW [Methylococcaceae bacterium]